MIYPSDPKFNLKHNAPLIEIATRDIICLQGDDALGNAARLMAEKKISSIVITDGDHPAGIITERNLLHAMEAALPPDSPLSGVMSAPVITVPPFITCLEAYQTCLRDGIRHLVIVDQSQKLLGIVSEADFRHNFNLAALTGRRHVATVMSRSVFSTSPEESLQNTLGLMRTHQDSCVVVVVDNRPVGILTERDVVRLYASDSSQTGVPVSQVMSSPVLTIRIDNNVNEAAELMMTANVRHLVVVDTQGQLAGIIAEHDLTHNLANSLLDSKQLAEGALLDTLVSTLPDLVWVKDGQGVYLACNPRFEKFFGASEDEIIGKTDYDFVEKEIADHFRKHDLLAIKKNGPSVNEEWVRFAHDGHEECLETIKTPMHDMQGRLIGVLGIARDITERKKAEAEIRIAATAFESLEGIIITDAEANILRVNRAFTETTGYTSEEAVGKNPRLLNSGRHDSTFYSRLWESIAQTGSWEGEIWNRRKNGEVYPEHLTIAAVHDEHGTLTNYVATFIDITLSKAAAEKIERLAFYDPLTELPNRRLLLDRLKLALASSTRHRRHGALLFLDLDQFKTLNDTLGHDIGDKLLQQVATRLKDSVREDDTVARFGGDEFVVMLEELGEREMEAAAQAESIAAKILITLNRPYALGRHNYRSTPSIGITLFNDHVHSIDELLKQADIAMYQAKKAGRNTLQFFDPGMQDSINARVALENELRNALNRQEFELYYQVQMHSSGRVLGAEALVRWNHPTRGVVLPAEFIPLAEETGLILSIGQWILESACTQLDVWQQDPLTRDLTLSVNVSARQFHQENFVPLVLDTLEGHVFPRSLLKLELTESLLLENVDHIIASMNVLRGVGIHFSLDDFGTGYSSLQYLKRLPLHQLKIDQTFVRDLVVDASDEAIVRTIIAMAQSLDLEYIAEGVETEAQQRLLLSYGCQHYQGYLYGKPLRSQDFGRMLQKNFTM